jgi:hypothetical protein
MRPGLTLSDRVKAEALICGSPRKYRRNSPSEQGIIEMPGFLFPGQKGPFAFHPTTKHPDKGKS